MPVSACRNMCTESHVPGMQLMISTLHMCIQGLLTVNYIVHSECVTFCNHTLHALIGIGHSLLSLSLSLSLYHVQRISVAFEHRVLRGFHGKWCESATEPRKLFTRAHF